MNKRINNYEFYPNKKEVGQKIKKYRKNSGVTASQLADMLGYDSKTINKWEQGRGFPSDQNLVNLSEIFKCTVDDLLFSNHKCITNYKINYTMDSYSHSLFQLLINNCLCSNYHSDFKMNLDEIEMYLERQDYILQKYLKSFLNKEEYNELYFILNNTNAYDDIHFEFSEDNLYYNLLEEIREKYISNGYNSLDDALFEIQKMYTSPLQITKLLVSIFRYSIIDRDAYHVIVQNMSIIERDLIYNLIVKNNIRELKEIAIDLYNSGARLNETFPIIMVDFNMNNIKSFYEKYLVNNENLIYFFEEDFNDWYGFDTKKISSLRTLYGRLDIVFILLEYTHIFKSINTKEYYKSYRSDKPKFLED